MQKLVNAQQVKDFASTFFGDPVLKLAANAVMDAVPGIKWISVADRKPDTIPCNAGTQYSEAVIVCTSGKKVMCAVWNGTDFLCPMDYWEAWDEEITHWMPTDWLLPLPVKGRNGG